MRTTIKNTTLLFIFISFCLTQVFGSPHFFPHEDLIVSFSKQFATLDLVKNGIAGVNGYSLSENRVQSMLRQQVQMQAHLSNQDWFTDHIDEFRELYEYSFGQEERNEKSVFAPEEDFLLNFVQRVEELSKKHQRKRVAGLKTLVIKSLEELSSKGPEGLLIGLISTLPREHKSKIFKIDSLKERLEALRKIKINERDFNSNFDFERHGLDPKSGSFSRVLEEIEKRSNDVEELFALYSILSLKSSKKKITDESVRELISKVFDASNNEISKLFGSLDINVANKASQSLISWYKKENAVKKKVVTKNVKPQFILAEVPAYIGIFRGCFGGDCSTSYSWPFPNSPFEKIFYIVNKSRIVGYVSVTIVKIDGKRTLLVKDIQGPNVSKEMVHDILEFLHFKYSKFADAPGGLAITKREFIQGNNYYQPIKDILYKYIQDGKKTTATEFLDTRARTYFSSRTRATYDSPSVHGRGTLVNFGSKRSPTKKHMKRKSRFDFFSGTEEEMHNRYYRFDKDLVFKIFKNEVDINNAQLSLKEEGFVNKVYDDFENFKKLSVFEFDSQIERVLSKHFSPEEVQIIRESNKSLLTKLRLSTKDALSTSHYGEFKKTHDLLFWYFENGDVTDLIPVFKEKIVTTPDEWFIDELIQKFKAGSENVLNNITILSAAGIRFLDDKQKKKIDERIKADLLLNLPETIDSGEINFRFISKDKFNQFTRALHQGNISGRFNLKVSYKEKRDALQVKLNNFGLSVEEAFEVKLFKKPLLRTFLSTKDFFSLDDGAEALKLLKSFNRNERISMFEEIMEYFESVYESYIKRGYFRNQKWIDHLADMIEFFLSNYYNEIRKTKGLESLITKVRALSGSNYFARVLLPIFANGDIEKEYTAFNRAAQTLWAKQGSYLDDNTLKMLASFEKIGYELELHSNFMTVILRTITADEKKGRKALRYLINKIRKKKNKQSMRSAISNLRRYITANRNLSNETRILLSLAWVRLIEQPLNKSQITALENDIELIEAKSLSALEMRLYNSLIKYSPKYNNPLSCKGIL